MSAPSAIQVMAEIIAAHHLKRDGYPSVECECGARAFRLDAHVAEVIAADPRITVTVSRRGTGVEVGQRWADNDRRMQGRVVTVLEVGETHAVVADSIGKKTRIRLDRFRPTSTGYRLVGDA